MVDRETQKEDHVMSSFEDSEEESSISLNSEDSEVESANPS